MVAAAASDLPRGDAAGPSAHAGARSDVGLLLPAVRFEDRSKGASKFGPQQRREYLLQLRGLYRDLNPWPLKLSKFLATGAFGILPNLLVLNLIVRLGGRREVAVAAAWFVAMSLNYVLNREWTFRAGHQRVVSSYFKYALAATGGLGVQVAVMQGLPAWNVNLSALLGIAAGTLFNFLASQTWVFARKGRETEGMESGR
jgi:putative flippase GtrA